MAAYVGVDLGATKIKAAVGTVANVYGDARIPTPHGPRGIDVTEGILQAIRIACDDAGIPPEELEAGAIGSFGPFDLAEGMVVAPANLPDSVAQIPLTGPVSTLIDSDDIYLHNDTTAGLIGERFIAQENPADMVYLTISTGIGAGIAVDGHVLAGWDGNVGEVGHFTIDPTGRLTCGCGRDGHWEAYTSGSGIPRYARYLAETLDDIESDLDVDAPNFSAADVFAAAGRDPLADVVLARVGEWNAIGLANVVHAYAPFVVSVGGAVALNNESIVLDPMRGALDDLVLTNVPEVRLTALGDDVVVLGALASAMSSGTGNRAAVSS